MWVWVGILVLGRGEGGIMGYTPWWRGGTKKPTTLITSRSTNLRGNAPGGTRPEELHMSVSSVNKRRVGCK